MLRSQPACQPASLTSAGCLLSEQVLSSSLDGTLRQWDIQEGRTLRNWQIGAAVESMVGSSPFKAALTGPVAN